MSAEVSTRGAHAQRQAARVGDKPRVVHPDDTPGLSYAALERQSAAFASLLAARGVRAGDRVAVVFNNRATFFVCLFGAARIGAITVPLDQNLAPAELGAILAHATPALIVVSAANEPKFRDLAASTSLLQLSDEPLTATDAPHVDVRADATVLILYTSGTTGAPKGVLHSHATILSKLATIQSWFGHSTTASGRCACCRHRTSGTGSSATASPRSSTVGRWCSARPSTSASSAASWSLVEKHQVNTFSSVPTIVRSPPQGRGDEPGRARGKPALRDLQASAPLGVPELERFEATFGVPLLNCYGITETASWTAYSPRTGVRNKASVGTAFGCEIRAVDPHGGALAAGLTGQLQVRGPSVMLGYYQAPDLTTAAIRDGWFNTGDEGYVDTEGRTFLLARIKELIIRAGLNIYPGRGRRCAHQSPRRRRGLRGRPARRDPRREGRCLRRLEGRWCMSATAGRARGALPHAARRVQVPRANRVRRRDPEDLARQSEPRQAAPAVRRGRRAMTAAPVSLSAPRSSRRGRRAAA